MNKQDRNGVRTAQDIERKYNFSSLKKAVELSNVGLNKVEKQLDDFASATIDTLENMQNQIDGNITTYYYSGVPTLSNLPASEWTTTSEKNKHIGDLYYDKNTGYAYRFYLDNGTYGWIKITDSDVTEALAIANAASDTADSKRRVFVDTPEPPYDNGDLWVNNEELYICQISKDGTESYEVGDFIVATKYTDDTVANRVGDNLQVLQGTVLQIQESSDEFKISIDTQLKKVKDDIEQSKDTISNMSYSFNTDDLTIAKSTDPVNAKISNSGMKVYSYSELQNIVNHNGSGSKKLIVTGDTQLANIRIVKAIDDNNKNCTDIHYLVSNIQTLNDLE